MRPARPASAGRGRTPAPRRGRRGQEAACGGVRVGMKEGGEEAKRGVRGRDFVSLHFSESSAWRRRRCTPTANSVKIRSVLEAKTKFGGAGAVIKGGSCVSVISDDTLQQAVVEVQATAPTTGRRQGHRTPKRANSVDGGLT